MSKVLFVAKFNKTTQNLQKFLSESIAIQLCSDNDAIAATMVNMYAPDLVLLNLEDFGEEHEKIFEDMLQNHSDIPVVTVGTEKERDKFARFYQSDQFHNVERPADGETVFKTIFQYMKKSPNGAGDVDLQLDKKKKILIVDDSPVILRSMRQMLEETYHVMMATSAKQAFTMIEKEMPDAVILDYEMPVCDGKETLERLRDKEETKDLPVVFLTGHGDADHIRAVLDLNPSAYFLKPPKAEKILEILGQLL